jgi:uncharacterized protein YjbI with pentapeptide repeats
MITRASYTQQHCQADIVIEPYPDKKTVKLTLSNIGNVSTTILDNNDGVVVTEEYQELDSTAIKLALTRGEHVLLQVGERGRIFQIFSVSKNNNGIIILRAIVSQPIVVADELKGASVTVTTYGFDHACDYLDHGCNDHWFYKDKKCEFVSIDSKSGDLIFDHDTPALGIPEINSLVVIQGKRDGSNKIKTMIGFLDRIWVDGKRIKFRISKKGLKSKGCAAKKAVDGFKNGEYQLQSMRGVDPVFGIYWRIAGTLRKTPETGTVELEFQTTASPRLYEVDPATKFVSSKSVDDYLENVAQSISETSGKSAAASAPTAFTITMFQEEQGLGYTGFITNLSWTAKGYIATVNLTFSDYEALEEKISIQNFHILLFDPRFRPLPNRPGVIRVRENFENRDFTAGTDLSGSNFSESTFSFANLTRVNLKNTNFFMSTLTNTTFRYANLEKAFLQLANLTEAILTGANLTRAILTSAILTGANLTRANLTGANLTDADLTRAILTEANFTDAILIGANLTGANLTDADLTRAILIDADLTGADLTRADLRGAVLNRTNFTGANLAGALFD